MTNAPLLQRIAAIEPGRIDTHTHSIDPRVGDLFEGSAGAFPIVRRVAEDKAHVYFGGEFYREIDERCWSPDVRLRDMDAEGVAAQFVAPMPATMCYEEPAEEAARWAALQNDALADLVAAAPHRFFALGAVPLQDPDAATAELVRCVSTLGFIGVQIGTRAGAMELTSGELSEFFECASRLGAVVFIHPIDRDLDRRLSSLRLGFGVGMPAETAAAAAAWLTSEAPERFRDLRLVFAHGAGALPSILPRVAHGQLVVDGVTDPRRLATTRAAKLWCDTLTYDADAVVLAGRRFTEHHLVMGSDYPFAARETPAGAVLEDLRGVMNVDALGRHNALALLEAVRPDGWSRGTP